MPNANPPQATLSFYPTIKIDLIKNPSRFYATPIIGGFVKLIMIIPIAVYLGILSIGNFFVLIINSFFVLFTGKYWLTAYNFNLGLFRLTTKVSFFMNGLTNKYPGFSLKIDDQFSFDMEMPKNPSRLFAIPIFGILARVIMIIPFYIYSYVIQYATNLATVVSSFVVFFKGTYPEATFELNRDTVRLSQASGAYMVGFSDSYPNFWISMNHKRLKIFLIVLSSFLIIFNWFRQLTYHPQTHYNYYQPKQTQQNKTSY